MRNILAIALGSLIFLAACAPPGPTVRPDPVDARQAQIERFFERGAYADAAQGWLDLAKERPERADAYRVRAAEAWLRLREEDSAESLLDLINPQLLDRTARARFELARAELAMMRGDLGMAGWLLAHAGEDLPEALRTRHQQLEERLVELETHPARQALAVLDEAMAEGDFEPELALALLIDYPLSALEGIVYEHGHRHDLLPWLDLVVSAREHLLDEQALQPALKSWQSRYPTIDYSAEEALLWLAAWRQSYPRPARIDVALPGPNTPLYRAGAALQAGLVSAWLDIAPQRRPELRFHHIGSDPDDIVATWFDAREQGAEMLIGPLDRAQVNALVALPDAGLLPTLLLNLPDDPALLTNTAGLAALALPPEEEAELAAVRALIDGHERALVLAQYTSWGERVAQAFVETFELGGGRILENRLYDPIDSDHSFLLRRVLEIDQSEERANRLQQVIGEPIESVAQRRTDVDLIFLAARADDGRQLRPQLRFFDAGDVPLMSTSHIVAGTPEPARIRDLDGVILPISPWFLDTTAAGEVRARAERRHEHLGNPAQSRLHALGRDAMALVPWLQLMRADEQLYLPGMTGRLTMPDAAVLTRDLPFIRIDNGRVRPH
jgi:uncharacterized protein